MASTQFLIPNRSGLAALAESCAYMLGQDGSPWNSHVQFADGCLTVTRDSRESGRLVTPWPLPNHGYVALSTTMLAVRPEPYQLALELCRGTLARVLGSLAARGIESDFRDRVVTAQHLFIEASLNQQDIDRSAAAAEASMDVCLSMMDDMVVQSAEQDGEQPFSSRLTGFQLCEHGDVGAVSKLRPMPGNAFVYSPSWCELEPNPDEWDWTTMDRELKWLRSTRRRLIFGPMLRLQRDLLPDWLYLWDDDFDAVQSYVSNYIHAMIARIKPTPNVWYASAGTNVDRELRLTEEQRLRLTLVALEAIRQEDRQTPVLLGIKQPWGEYMGRSDADLSPLQFADIVLRAELGVSGIALEMHAACQPQHTMPRDPLELSRLVDQWSGFSLPLVFIVSGENMRSQAQRQLVQSLEVLRHKQAVQGVIWGRLADPINAGEGVLDRQRRPKPMLNALREIWAKK